MPNHIMPNTDVLHFLHYHNSVGVVLVSCEEESVQLPASYVPQLPLERVAACLLQGKKQL